MSVEPPPTLDPTVVAGRPEARSRPVRAILRHWPLAVLLTAGAVIRGLAIAAIWPGIWFSDSNAYITTAATGELAVERVMGYSLVVAPFWKLGSAGALIVLQHVLGLAIAATIYALALRRGAPRWLALLAAVPPALDGYLVVIEHTIMSETIYHSLVVALLVVLLWGRGDKVGVATAAAAGLLAGAAVLLRNVAIPFVAILLVYLLLRRAGWRAIAVFLVAWAVPLLAYAAVFDHQYGSFALTQSGGRFLYARVAPFADCSKLGDLPASQRRLCPDPENRLTTNTYLWGHASPIHRLPVSADREIGSFAGRVILHQPGAYARVVVGGVLHYFRPGHPIGPNDYPVQPWQFPADPRTWGYPGYRGPIRPGDPRRARRHPIIEPNQYVGRLVAAGPRLDPAVARVVHRYQAIVYSYGPMLAVCLLLVVAALVVRRGAGRLRLDAALVAAMVLAALAMSQALSVFSYRYGMIGGVLLPLAGALAATALLDRRRAGARSTVSDPG